MRISMRDDVGVPIENLSDDEVLELYGLLAQRKIRRDVEASVNRHLDRAAELVAGGQNDRARQYMAHVASSFKDRV